MNHDTATSSYHSKLIQNNNESQYCSISETITFFSKKAVSSAKWARWGNRNRKMESEVFLFLKTQPSHKVGVVFSLLLKINKENKGLNYFGYPFTYNKRSDYFWYVFLRSAITTSELFRIAGFILARK